MEHSDKPADDALLREASDWKLRLDEAPRDPALRRACADWRARDERHENAWRRVSEAWALIGDLPVQRRQWPGHDEAPVRHWRWPRGAALALAACLLLALMPAAWRYWQADYRTGVGQTLAVTLADGSAVVLGADSALAEAFSDGERRVRLLRGEAFFDVAADPRPFLVVAGEVRARDIGTAFSVREDDGSYGVGVSHGEVAVSYRGGRARHLMAGDQWALDRASGTARVQRSAPDRVAVWRQGRLFVQDRTLADLADTLERHAHGYILIADDALAARRVTGSYDLSDVDAALAAMVQPHGGRVLRITPLLRIVL